MDCIPMDRSGRKTKVNESKANESKVDVAATKATEYEYPDCIYLMKESIPHDWLFPQMSLVMHHGGAGTVAAGLRAGVPTVIRPFFGDQFFWGEKILEVQQSSRLYYYTCTYII